MGSITPHIIRKKRQALLLMLYLLLVRLNLHSSSSKVAVVSRISLYNCLYIFVFFIFLVVLYFSYSSIFLYTGSSYEVGNVTFVCRQAFSCKCMLHVLQGSILAHDTFCLRVVSNQTVVTAVSGIGVVQTLCAVMHTCA